MLKLVAENNLSKFDHIYDKYSSLLYGVILKMSLNEDEAERILIKSFNHFFSQESTSENDNSIFLRLLRITVKVISEQINISRLEISKKLLRNSIQMHYS